MNIFTFNEFLKSSHHILRHLQRKNGLHNKLNLKSLLLNKINMIWYLVKARWHKIGKVVLPLVSKDGRERVVVCIGGALNLAKAVRGVGWSDRRWWAGGAPAWLLINLLTVYVNIKRSSSFSLALKPLTNRYVRKIWRIYPCIEFKILPIFPLLQISLHRCFSACWTFSFQNLITKLSKAEHHL